MAENLTVGVVGADDIGLPMVRNLVDAGFDVAVFDPDEDAIGAIPVSGLASQHMKDLDVDDLSAFYFEEYRE